jgi:hypothetical protein
VGTFQGFTGVLHRIGLNNEGPCVANAAGIVTCDSTFGGTPPAIALSTFGLSSDIRGESGCGLDAQGLAHCWGDGIDAPTPAGPFSAIAVGDGNACGVRPNGSLTCWGDDESLQAAPAGQFTDLSVADGRACAVATAGHVECWGDGTTSQPAHVDGSFKQVMLLYGTRCTLDTAGAIDCLPVQLGTPPAGPFEQLVAGTSFVCGLRADGSVGCQGDDAIGRLAPPPGTWSDIASYNRAVCVRSEDGQSACWGYGYGDGGSELACETSETRLDGTLDGAATSLDRTTSKQATFDDLTGFRWTYRTFPEMGTEPGILILEGTEEQSNEPSRSLMNGQMVSVDYALLHVGSSATAAGRFYCSSGSSTATMHVDELTLALQNLHALGGCPGTPVSGELTACYGCGDGLSGTVDGKTVALRADEAMQIGPTAGNSSFYHEDGTLTDIMKTEGGAVAWAVIAMPFNGPHAGAVYCAGEGSTWVVSDDGQSTVSTLRNLSKLPSCPTGASTDALTGCVR